MRANLVKKVLTLMCDGQERSIPDVIAAVDCTRAQADIAMHNGRRRGYYSIRRQHYTITDVGRAREAHRLMSPEELEAKRRIRQKRVQERRKAESAARRAAKPHKAPPPQTKPSKAVPAPVLTIDLVSLAVSTRPALDMAWMSVAREQEASHV
jgi:hypothetical protein